MADNSVFITGASSGAFTDAFSELPPWATESTALQIEKYLRKSFDVQSKIFDAIKKMGSGSGAGSNKLSPEDAKKVNDELDKLAKNLKRNNEEDAKKRKRNKDLEKDEKEELLRGKKKKAQDEKMSLIFGAIASVGNNVLGVYKDYIDVYDSMYQSGINVMNGQNSTASGFETLNQVVNLTGLRLQTLQKVAEKYASTVNAVGFVKFAKSIAMTNTRLQALGYSSEAQAELIGTLMESEMGYADIRNKSADQIAADAIKLGAQLGKLSQTVGLSREQLQENLKATSKSTESAFVFAKYGKEAADKLNAAASGIKDSGLRDMFMQLASAANPAQVKGYNELVQAGLGDVAQQMDALAKGMMNMDPVEFQKKFSALSGYIEQQTGRMGNLTNLLGQGGEEAARILNAFYQQGRSVSKATEGQQDNATRTQASIAGLQTQMESFAATLQKAFFPLEKQVDLVTKGLTLLNGAIDRSIAAFEAETRSWVGVGLIIAGLISSLVVGKKTLGTIFDILKGGASMLGRAVTGIGRGIASAGSLILKAGKSIGSVIGRVASSAGSVGSILGRIGGFFLRFLGPLAALYAAFELGKAIGSVLYETLSSFDWFNDAMDSFFSAFDKSIDWVVDMGKTIGNKFSEFGSWLYDSMMGVGKWISSAFDTVAGFIKGAGDFIYGKMTDAGKWIASGFDVVLDSIKGIGNKFLSYMPFLKEIGDYFIAVKDRVKYIFNEVSSFTDSLIEVLKTILKRFANSVTFGLIGGDEEKKEGPRTDSAKPTSEPSKAAPVPVQVVTPVTPPQGMSVPKAPAATTISSPSTVTTSADGSPGNAAMPTSTVSSVLPTGIKKPDKNSDINNLLTYQGSLLEQILLSTNSLVSVNKDILRYARNSA